jgi:hypothetical protein
VQNSTTSGPKLQSQVKDKIEKRYCNIQQLGRISDSVKKIEGLDLRDILMTDATIITGVLILVSISASNPNPVVGVITPIGLFVVALMIVLLFSISAYSALEGNLKNAKRFAQWGFIALMMSFGITLFAALVFQIQHPPTPS